MIENEELKKKETKNNSEKIIKYNYQSPDKIQRIEQRVIRANNLPS